MSIIRPSDSVFSLSTNDLFKMIASECGEEVVDIVKAQGISNIHSLLGVSDILDFVHLPSPALRDLKMKVAWELTDGSWFIMPGFRARVDLFMNKLRVQVELEDRYHSPSSASVDHITLDSALLVEYPLLASLIRFYTTLRKESNQHDLSLLSAFVENVTVNLQLRQNNLRYSDLIRQFALSLYLLGGRNCYEFARLNITGLLPSLTTVQAQIASSKYERIHEGTFHFDSLVQFLSIGGCKVCFCAEDATGVIQKVTYDASMKTFVGFVARLEDGRPQAAYFRTDSYQELQGWFAQQKKATLLNIHVVQGLPSTHGPSPVPFVLAAYGTDNCFSADDVLTRWKWMFDEILKNGIRILGFSTDCDSRYLRSMRIASGFFTTVDPSIRKHPSAFDIHIPLSWHWFFLHPKQLFLVLQVKL